MNKYKFTQPYALFKVVYSVHLFLFCYGKDSSSVVEWTQRPHRSLDQQLSYETEWDMVNTVSFKRKVHTNGEGEVL